MPMTFIFFYSIKSVFFSVTFTFFLIKLAHPVVEYVDDKSTVVSLCGGS
jgi:hypothetical protein